MRDPKLCHYMSTNMETYQYEQICPDNAVKNSSFCQKHTDQVNTQGDLHFRRLEESVRQNWKGPLK